VIPTPAYARRAMDHVGVLTGWRRSTTARITKAQFLDLNERIGGLRRQRHLHGGAHAGRTGRHPRRAPDRPHLNGGGGLASTPISTGQLDTEELPTGDLHLSSSTT
jgi:hypothetical protein